MIDPRRRMGGSTLQDVQASGSGFRDLAQRLGMANPPTNFQELMTYLSEFLSGPQIELLQYLVTPPQQFVAGNNLFPPGEPMVQGMTADVPPAADQAAAAGNPNAPTGSTTPAGAGAAPAGGGTSTGYASPYQGLSGFDAATGKPRLAPSSMDPDAAGLMARNPGMYVQTPEAEAAKYAQTATPEQRIQNFIPVSGVKAPSTDAVSPNQAPRYVITLPSGEKQNIY